MIDFIIKWICTLVVGKTDKTTYQLVEDELTILVMTAITSLGAKGIIWLGEDNPFLPFVIIIHEATLPVGALFLFFRWIKFLFRQLKSE